MGFSVNQYGGCQFWLAVVNQCWSDELSRLHNSALLRVYSEVQNMIVPHNLRWGNINIDSGVVKYHGRDFQLSKATLTALRNYLAYLYGHLPFETYRRDLDLGVYKVPEQVFLHVYKDSGTVSRYPHGLQNEGVRIVLSCCRQRILDNAQQKRNQLQKAQQQEREAAYIRQACLSLVDVMTAYKAEQEDKAFRETILCSD